MIKLSYSAAKASFASLWDRIIDEQEMVVLQRKGKEDIVMMPASEARSLLETAHVLGTPANARRLFASIDRAEKGEVLPVDLDELRQRYGLQIAVGEQAKIKSLRGKLNWEGDLGELRADA